MHEEVQLTYSVSKTDDQHIRLVFSVKNGLPSDIYLFTPLTDYRGSQFVPIANRVYVFWENREVLHLTKRLWPIPKDISVYMPEVPYLTRVPAGATHREEIQLPVPLLINFPYRFNDAEDEGSPQTVSTTSAQQVVFSIGYLKVTAANQAKPIVFEKVDHYYRVGYGIAKENQMIVRGEPIALQVMTQEAK